MNVRELIEWLKTQDQEAIVEVLEGDTRNSPPYPCNHVEFDKDSHVEYTDFRNNKFAKGKDYENTRILFLGSEV